MIDKGTVVLQNCRHPLEVESDSHIGYASSSHNGIGVIDIKVEVSYIGENEYAMPTTFSEISAEEEVSFMSCVSVHFTYI